jgi:hypothetical protein
MKTLALGVLTSIGLIAAVNPAQAAYFTFEIQNGTFAGNGTLTGGGILTGSFVYDSDSGDFIKWNIESNNVTLNQATNPFTYKNTNSSLVESVLAPLLPARGEKAFYAQAADATGNRTLSLIWDKNLTSLSVGQTTSFLINAAAVLGSNDSYSGLGVSQTAGISGGLLFLKKVDTEVPEPLTMLGAGAALGFGGLFKGKLAKAKSGKKSNEG